MAGLNSRVPNGKTIGHHHDGFLRVAQFKYSYNSGFGLGDSEFQHLATQHIKTFGYSVADGGSSLFGNSDSKRPEFLLGGTITKASFNTFAPLAGNYSAASLTIEWQVFDTFLDEVIYSSTTKGRGQGTRDGAGCVEKAVISSLDHLLSDQGFVDVVKSESQGSFGEENDRLTKIIVNVNPQAHVYQLPGDLASVLPAVLTVLAGDSFGSGVLVSSDGWAITAGHVVAGKDEVVVRLNSGLELTAEVVRIDRPQDVALIRLPGSGHPFLDVIDQSAIQIGQDLFVIGTPASEVLEYSVSKGIVSGLRELNGKKFLQTDAAVNPGNSGGPILSVNGTVMAIVALKVSGLEFEGLAFGVPIDALSERLQIEWRN